MSVVLTGQYFVSPGVPDRGRVYLEAVTVNPASGEVTPLSRIVDREGRVVFSRTDTISIELDGLGAFAIPLPASDDPNLDPSGFGWRLSPRLASGAGPPVVFPLLGPGPVDVSDVVAGSPVARWPWFDVTKKASDVLLEPLERFPDVDNVQEAVEAIASYTVSGDVGAHVDDPNPHPQYASRVEVDDAITAHEDSLMPHPAYDDGPSLLLLYSNAKV